MIDPESFSAAPNGLDGMADSLSKLFDSFQRLAGDPANFGRRRDVVRSAQNIAAQFNQAMARLNDLEGGLDASAWNDDVRARPALTALQDGLNKLAAQLIVRVNNIYSAGFDLDGRTGRNLFTGTGADDIGVSNDVVDDPARLQADGTLAANVKDTVTQTLAKLGGRNISDLGHQSLIQSHAQTVAELGSALLRASDVFVRARPMAKHGVAHNANGTERQRSRRVRNVLAKMTTPVD